MQKIAFQVINFLLQNVQHNSLEFVQCLHFIALQQTQKLLENLNGGS